MSRKKRTKEQQALIELRHALELSQRAFAKQIDRTFETVARWETIRPPGLTSLLILEEFAKRRGQPGLAGLFREAFYKRQRLPAPQPGDVVAMPVPNPEMLLESVIAELYGHRLHPAFRRGFRKLFRSMLEMHARLIERARTKGDVEVHNIAGLMRCQEALEDLEDRLEA